MIVMIVADVSQKEGKCIIRYTKESAAKWTEEFWDMEQCGSAPGLEEKIRKKGNVQMICADITIAGILDLLKKLRKEMPSTYLVLIASADISPLVYMRPSIRAESLLLRPLSGTQVQAVMEEAVADMAEQFYKPDEGRMFVVENKGGRDVIAYNRIYFFEARDKRIFVNTGMEEYGFYGTIEQLEERFDEEFIRCHRSFLVNKKKIASVYLSQNRLILENKMEVPLSRTYKPLIREFLDADGLSPVSTAGKPNLP